MKQKIINWIKTYIEDAKASGIILGMSGGKDSLICAKLCTEALGKDKVLGIIMPNGNMRDLSIAKESCQLLGINYYVIDINNMYNEMISKTIDIVKDFNKELSSVTTDNIPPRLRTNTLYSIAGSLNYLVVNTSNLSETMIGYTTKWGDNVGDISPLSTLTKSEVCLLGLELGLPDRLVNKVPDDGLCGKTDEDKIGFKYSELDEFIRKGVKGQNFDKIERMYKLSSHKRIGIARFNSGLKNYFDEV